MNLPKLTENLNIHQSLEDQPTLSSSELKVKFDEAGNKIKDYINNILIETLLLEVPKEISDKIQIAIDDINDTLDSLKGEIDNKLEEFNNTMSDNLSKTINNDDFITSSHSGNYSLTPGASSSPSVTVTKAGYYPLGVVGMANTTANWCDLKKWGLTSRNSGSAVFNYTIVNGDGGNNRSGSVTFTILWVKIK